jgi:hypothetical protein
VVELEDIVHRVNDFAGDAGLVNRQPNRKVAVPERDERIQQGPDIE